MGFGSLVRLAFAATATWLLSAEAASTVFFQPRTRGNIFALANDQSTSLELGGLADAPRLSAVALSPDRVFWSDTRSIRSARATDGADVRSEVGALVRVRWVGINFGAAPSDVVALLVLNTSCVSVARWSPTEVECLVAVPLVGASPVDADCEIRTTRGAMRGVARNNFDELRASGAQSPVVERVEITVTSVAPHALAIDGAGALFWSNAVDGAIYRSSLVNTAIDVVQTQAWGVKGLALLRRPTPAPALELLFSLEGKGLVQRTWVAPGVSASVEAETVLTGLRSPRGLAVDPTQQFLYFTEKTGRIYRSALASLKPMAAAAPPSRLPEPQLLVTVSTLTRLHGLAVDDTFVYWCESNSNVVARASVDSFEREVVVGGSADSALSWPRSVALKTSDGAANAANGDFFYVEYTGRISKA